MKQYLSGLFRPVPSFILSPSCSYYQMITLIMLLSRLSLFIILLDVNDIKDSSKWPHRGFCLVASEDNKHTPCLWLQLASVPFFTIAIMTTFVQSLFASFTYLHHLSRSCTSTFNFKMLLKITFCGGEVMVMSTHYLTRIPSCGGEVNDNVNTSS